MRDLPAEHYALKECLDALKHLFVDIARLKYEPAYGDRAARGGYGKVQVATLDPETPDTRKLVAVKTLLLRPQQSEPLRLAFRLARELKVWAGLRHPHILPLLGYYLDDDYQTAALISEFMEYGDLKYYIAMNSPSYSERLNLVRDLTDGLAYLHAQACPVRHGDLKPGNVLVNREHRALLADFGLSKALDAGSTGFTTDTDLKCTVRYSGPEVLLGGPDEQSLVNDIWSWACLAFEVLTDNVPFSDVQSEIQLIVAHVQGQSPCDENFLALHLPQFNDLLWHCWDQEPCQRPRVDGCLSVIQSALSDLGPAGVNQLVADEPEQLKHPADVHGPPKLLQELPSQKTMASLVVSHNKSSLPSSPKPDHQHQTEEQSRPVQSDEVLSAASDTVQMGQTSGESQAGRLTPQLPSPTGDDEPDLATFLERIDDLPMEAIQNRLFSLKSKIKALEDERDRVLQDRTLETLEQALNLQVQVGDLRNVKEKLIVVYTRRQVAATGLEQPVVRPLGQSDARPLAIGSACSASLTSVQKLPPMGPQVPQDGHGSDNRRSSKVYLGDDQQRRTPPSIPSMQSESTVTGRKLRNLGLSVFNADDSSDDDVVPIQCNTPHTTAQLLPKPLPVPGVAQGSYFPQQPPLQQPQSPYTARPAQRQPSHLLHSASSSTSSISISTSLSSQPSLQLPNGGRQAGAQSSPTSRYANASLLNYVGSSSSFGSSSYGDNSQNHLQPQPVLNPSPVPTGTKVDRREPVDKLILTVTPDAENWVIADITGAKNAAFIRERMFSKLRIPDDDHENYQIYRTELGEAALGDPVTDDQLLIYCEAWADAKGTLKFLVERDPTAPPPQPQFVAPTQQTTTPHVQTPHAIPYLIPPLFLSPYDRRRADNAAGGLFSADRDQDRPPWDKSNMYDVDVDRGNRRRHQSPTPIDAHRRREPSTSGSGFSSFSPTSPSGPQANMTSAPHGWVLVNEVLSTPTSTTGSDRYGNSQRSPSSGGSNTTGGVNDWVGSPPSEGPRMSPATATTPSASRPYPHATNTSYTATTPTLTRAHPPTLPGGTGKYPNPHPHPRTGTGGYAALPPGAVDPRMRQMERQQPPAGPKNQFYSPSVSATYNPAPAGYIPPQQSTPPSSRMLQPSGNSSGAEAASGTRGTLRSSRSMSDLNQRNVLNSSVPPQTSQSSNQIPTLARGPSAPPINSPRSDSLYSPSRQPTSPNQLPPSPSRPFTNPTWLYSVASSGSTRTPVGPPDYNYGLTRSLGSGASLFNSGVFADRPLKNPTNAVDRNMVTHVQPQVWDQGPPLQGPPLSTPGPSSSYKAGWLSNTSSPAPSRPNSGDVDNGDFNRPSPTEKSAMDALSMLETRRPFLPMVNVPTTPLESTERLASPWRETPAAPAAMQIPKAVVTPSSPIDPSTATIGVQLYDNPSPIIATTTSPALSSMSSTKFTDGGSEGTLQPGDRERLLSMAGSGNDADEEGTGTMKPGANRVTFSQVAMPVVITAKAKRISMRPARAKSVRRPPQQDAGEGGQPNGEEDEEEEYYYSSDSSEEDERFWNMLSAPLAIATPQAIDTSGPEEDGNSTLGSRRPDLTFGPYSSPLNSGGAFENLQQQQTSTQAQPQLRQQQHQQHQRRQQTRAPPRVASTQPDSPLQVFPQVNQQPSRQPDKRMQFHEFFTNAFNGWLAQRQLTLDPPRVEGKVVELHELFLMVGALGGCRAVCEKKLWSIVAAKIGFPYFNGPPPYSKPDVADQVSKFYREVLADFEVHWHNSLRPSDPNSTFPLPPQLQHLRPAIETLATAQLPSQQLQEQQQCMHPLGAMPSQQPDANARGSTLNRIAEKMPQTSQAHVQRNQPGVVFPSHLSPSSQGELVVAANLANLPSTLQELPTTAPLLPDLNAHRERLVRAREKVRAMFRLVRNQRDYLSINLPEEQGILLEQSIQQTQSMLKQVAQNLIPFVVLAPNDEPELNQIADTIVTIGDQAQMLQKNPSEKRFIFGLRDLTAYRSNLAAFLMRVKSLQSQAMALQNQQTSVPSKRGLSKLPLEVEGLSPGGEREDDDESASPSNLSPIEGQLNPPHLTMGEFVGYKLN